MVIPLHFNSWARRNDSLTSSGEASLEKLMVLETSLSVWAWKAAWIATWRTGGIRKAGAKSSFRSWGTGESSGIKPVFLTYSMSLASSTPRAWATAVKRRSISPTPIPPGMIRVV